MSDICGVKGCTSTTHTRKSHSTIMWQRKNPERHREGRSKVHAKRLREMQANPGDAMHGTQTGHVYGCRCERCTAAQREHSARWTTGKRFRIHKARYLGGPSRTLAPTFHTAGAAAEFIAARPYPAELYSIEDTQETAA